MDYFSGLNPLYFDGIDHTKPLIIAGPCSAETLSQVLTTAKQLAKRGIKIFRAGIWKPRTKPGGFEGVGAAGLQWLQDVKRITGMCVATEVANQAHVKAALEAQVDVLWIGARTSVNPFAMQEIADALRGHEEVTVLVKNPVNPDLELWIGGLERIYNSGIRRLGAIHRGFSTYGNHLYRNEPQWRIPIELRRRIPNLPILCDPSHLGGKRALISPIAQQALDLGFDGLMIESHCQPSQALSDSRQQLTPQALGDVLDSLVTRSVKPAAETLIIMRERIDQCDEELIEILGRRMALSREIGLFKRENNLQIVQTDRYEDILKHRKNQARELGVNEEFVVKVMQAVHEESVNQQLRIFKKSHKR